MTWGTHCPRCGLTDCRWIAGPTCEGGSRIKAFQAFAPEWRARWPIGTRWLARLISRQLVELESENSYFRAIVKKEYDNIRLVDVNVKPEEFQVLLQSGIGGILTSWMLQAIKSIGAKAYVEIMGEHPVEGKVIFTVVRMGGEPPGARAHRYEQLIRGFMSPVPYEKWHEAMGPCLWWHFDAKGNLTEPPYIGTPLDCGQTVEHTIRHHVGGTGEVKEDVHRSHVGGWPGYHTHFTRIPEASLTWAPPAAPPG